MQDKQKWMIKLPSDKVGKILTEQHETMVDDNLQDEVESLLQDRVLKTNCVEAITRKSECLPRCC